LQVENSWFQDTIYGCTIKLEETGLFYFLFYLYQLWVFMYILYY